MIAAIGLWNIVRWTLCVFAAANVGGCAAVIYFYGQRIDIEPGWGKWLPKHVWRVVLGTLALIISNLVFALDRLGSPPLWYGLPLVVPGNVLILWGLVYMVVYQRNRLMVARRPPGLKRLDDRLPETPEQKADGSERDSRRSS